MRLTRLKAGDKVLCLTGATHRNDRGKKILTKGEIYTVTEHTENGYMVLKETTYYKWADGRFEPMRKSFFDEELFRL